MASGLPGGHPLARGARAFCRSLDPNVLIHNRVGKRTSTDGDFDTARAGGSGDRIGASALGNVSHTE